MNDEHVAALRRALADQVMQIPLEVLRGVFERHAAGETDVAVACRAGFVPADGSPGRVAVLVISPEGVTTLAEVQGARS